MGRTPESNKNGSARKQQSRPAIFRCLPAIAFRKIGHKDKAAIIALFGHDLWRLSGVLARSD
jgi:hypothetical protein